jgi:hypothetical protein
VVYLSVGIPAAVECFTALLFKPYANGVVGLLVFEEPSNGLKIYDVDCFKVFI